MKATGQNGTSRLRDPSNVQPERPGTHPFLQVTRSGPPADLIAQARAAGRDNLPRSDSQQLSGPEDLIVSEHVRQHLSLVEHTRGRVRELTATFSKLEDQMPTPTDLAVVVQGSSASFERDLGDERLLVSERQQQQRGLRDERHLVGARGIDRPAHYPRSRRLHLAWVAVLATMEAGANAGFFEGLSSVGWIGGLAAAAAIAALNTGSGVLVGFTCLRGLHHHRLIVQRLSAMGVATYAVLALGFNLAVGRARDLAATGALSQQALRNLLRHPFDLSLLSAALVGVGLIAAAVSLMKGRSLDDPVPGYGSLHRRLVEADEHFAHTTNELRSRVMAHVDAVPDNLHAVVQRGAQLMEQLEATVVDTEKVLEAYESDRQHLDTSCTGMLRRFRSENERVRTTSVPSYFRTFPTYPSQVDAAPIGLLKGRLANVHLLFDQLKAEAHRLHAGQAQRVQAATRRFEEFFDGQVRRADAGRGDSEDAAGAGEGGPSS